VQPGELIAHYRLTARIGRDHNTVIYRARDLKLDRDVAVKLLSPEKTASAAARERFRREAHIASLVTHPHICAVHDSGEENGQAFLVCELLEGQALDEMLRAGPLAVDRLLDLAIQLADGVMAIHRRGIVHGNIKPSNMFITDDGHVKLLELGIVSAWWETVSHDPALDSASPTATLDRRAPTDSDVGGFHSYRSPEHLAGQPVDHRSDLFSIGAVLYEMATGHAAFPGETPSGIAASIVGGRPLPVATRNPLLPRALDAIVAKALEKAPDRRYQNAADLLADLRRAQRRLDSSANVPVAGRKPRRRIAAAAILAAVLITAAAAGWWWSRPGPPVARQALVVGSIANGTNDPDFDGTLRQALIVHLAQSPFLDIVSDDRIREMLKMMGRDVNAPMTHAVAREACQRVRAQAMIEGSVSAVGQGTVVALVASACDTGEPIARDQFEVQRKEDVLRAVGQIASSMRRSLGESVASLEGHNVPIEEATTPSLEALKAYTSGVEKRAAGAELDAVPLLERAIELDPKFALAYTVLSSIYGSLGETGKGEKYARLAYEHRATVTERERLFISYQYHDRVTGDQLKAREALEVWKQSYPFDYRPPNALAVLLLRIGDYEHAIAEAREAMRLNPAHPFPYSNLAYAYRGAGRYAEARATAEQSVAAGTATLPTRRLLYQIAELDGDQAAAAHHLEWRRTQTRTHEFDLIGAQAQVLAFRGQMAQARAAYRQTIEDARGSNLPQIASGYLAQSALIEALYGFREEAIAQAQQLASETAYEPKIRAATALAVAGAAADADKWLAQIRNVRPEDTLLHGAYIPSADAAVFLARDRADAAIDALRRATPYERGTVAALLPMYFRGQARLRMGAVADAVREFRSVLQYRGADPFSAVIPLSQLGLARALAQSGDVEGSRQAYAALLEMWRNADPDFAPLHDVRTEITQPTDRR
jgi:tetratricopeptide (TPR) repeat protein